MIGLSKKGQVKYAEEQIKAWSNVRENLLKEISGKDSLSAKIDGYNKELEKEISRINRYKEKSSDRNERMK